MASKTIRGIPVSAGISIGRAFFVNRSRMTRVPRQTVAASLIGFEKERLAEAFREAEEDLEAIRARVPDELKDHALIIDSHVQIMKDPKLAGAADCYVEKLKINAEWALEKAVADLHRAFSALDDPYIRERMEDVRLVAGRVQERLMGQARDVRTIEGRVVLMAHDLSPADTIELEVDKIMSFVTTLGAKTSHTGILARSLQIPAIVGATSLEESVKDGDLVIVDGFSGNLLIDPSEDELARYEEMQIQFETYQKTIERFCHLPGETRDGFRVQVLANIELFEEVTQVIDQGGDGIGLLRTEYKYINRQTLPTEEELFEEYRDLVSILAPQKVVIRTLDIGADKAMAGYGNLEEPNPALGLRAIRFCMRYPEIFKTQLRAILRASVYGNAAVMFPMISGLRELRYAKRLFLEAQQELSREGYDFNPDMPFGIMIEVPATVMVADSLAQEVDFFSIGTNDLIQYTLGIDRTNRYVSYLYQPLHPAVVRSIKMVVDAAHRAGIEVSLCGEMAADPFCVPILMGMQIDSLSLGPQAIPGIKRIIRRANMEECRQLLKLVLDSHTVTRTNRLVRDIIYQRFPEELTFFSSLVESEEPEKNELS